MSGVILALLIETFQQQAMTGLHELAKRPTNNLPTILAVFWTDISLNVHHRPK
jgi:hypothetical protein